MATSTLNNCDNTNPSLTPTESKKDRSPINDEICRRQEVKRISGLSKSALYREIAAGRFPAPVRIAARTVGWRKSEIAAWISSRPRVYSAIEQ